jgi:hypothetical protein
MPPLISGSRNLPTNTQLYSPQNEISGPEVRILGYQLAGRNATAEE